MFEQIQLNGCATPARLHLVSRQKLSGLPGRHFGVVAEFAGGEAEVYDLVQGQGMGVQDLSVFLRSRQGCIERTLIDPTKVREAWLRLNDLAEDPLSHRYDVVGQNCEHVARYVMDGSWKSRQVESLAVAGAVALLVLVLRRAA